MQQNILRFQVTMYNALGEQRSHGTGELAQKQADRVLAERSLDDQIIGQIATVAVLKYGDNSGYCWGSLEYSNLSIYQ